MAKSEAIIAERVPLTGDRTGADIWRSKACEEPEKKATLEGPRARGSRGADVLVGRPLINRRGSLLATCKRQFVATLIRSARRRANLGEWRAAYVIFSVVARLWTRASVLGRLGRAALAGDQYPAAMQAALDATWQSPNKPIYHCLLAHVYVHLGYLISARDSAERACQLAPSGARPCIACLARAAERAVCAVSYSSIGVRMLPFHRAPRATFMLALHSWLVVGVASRGISDDALRVRFLEEAPKSWEDLDNWMSKHSTVISHDHYRLSGERVSPVAEKDRRMEWKQSGKNVLLILEPYVIKGAAVQDRPDVETEVTCVNEQYAFRLARPADNSPWALTLLRRDPEYLRNWLRQGGEDLGTAGWTLDGFLLGDFLRDPGFHITGVEHVDRNGRACIQVDFDFSQGHSAIATGLRGGSLVFDPARHWVQVYNEIRIRYGEKDAIERTTFDYLDHPSGRPLLRRNEIVRTGNLPETELWSWEYAIDVDSPVSDKDFTMSAFGLPEPALPSEGPARLLGWVLILFSIPLFLLVQWLRRRSRRDDVGAAPYVTR